MKQRPGNILILTLIACTMLALVLMVGLEVAGLRFAVGTVASHSVGRCPG